MKCWLVERQLRDWRLGVLRHPEQRAVVLDAVREWRDAQAAVVALEDTIAERMGQPWSDEGFQTNMVRQRTTEGTGGT
jgi:hypothetical protein